MLILPNLSFIEFKSFCFYRKKHYVEYVAYPKVRTSGNLYTHLLNQWIWFHSMVTYFSFQLSESLVPSSSLIIHKLICTKIQFFINKEYIFFVWNSNVSHLFYNIQHSIPPICCMYIKRKRIKTQKRRPLLQSIVF